MTDGGFTKAEGWNLQLQGQVRELQAGLAKAEEILRQIYDDGHTSVTEMKALRFLRSVEAKRERAAQQAADIDALLAHEAPDAGKERGHTEPPQSTSPPPSLSGEERE